VLLFALVCCELVVCGVLVCAATTATQPNPIANIVLIRFISASLCCWSAAGGCKAAASPTSRAVVAALQV